jgi:chromosomal replication initiator protein
MTIELAHDVLRNMIDHDEKAITLEQIQKKVAEFYHLKLHELKSKNNAKSVAMPRQVAMYLCKMLTHASLPDIGKSFGGKHHSTVIHSIKKVEEMRQAKGDFDRQIAGLIDALQ